MTPPPAAGTTSKPGRARRQRPSPLDLALPAVLLLCLAAAPGCRPAPSPGPVQDASVVEPSTSRPVTVRLTPAVERPFPEFLRVTGQLQGSQDALVAADAGGKVIETLVERGSRVGTGDVLAKLDDRTARLSLDEAEAAVTLAQARLALARSEAERSAPLVGTRAIAEVDYRRLEADQAVREADLAAALARRDLARKALADCVVPAPFGGLVVERFVQPGEYVRPGTAIARMVEVSTLRLLLNVPETAAGQVRESQAVEFLTAAFPGAAFTGTLRFIGAAVRDSARDLLVEAEVPNGDGRLKPGFFAEARIQLGERRVVAVPEAALQVEGSRRSVFLVEQGTLVERLVETGDALAGWIEVRRGLRPEESVVAASDGPLADGLPATVAQP